MKFLYCLVFALFFSTALFGQKAVSKNKVKSGKSQAKVENKIAPPFAVKDLDGNKFKLQKLKGKIVVLNFWFAECLPCVDEIPNLNKLVAEYKDKNIVFLAFTEDKPAKIKSFLAKNPFKYNIVSDTSSAVINKYGTPVNGSSLMLYPTHIIIGRDGKIDIKVSGLEGIKAMQKGIKRILEAEKSK